MATLIPSIGTCVSRMTSGERRLEQKLDDDYLLWYDVPVGPKYGDFKPNADNIKVLTMHASKGLELPGGCAIRYWTGTTLTCRHEGNASLVYYL